MVSTVSGFARSNKLAKIEDKKSQSRQFSSGYEGDEISCPFVSKKLLHCFPKTHFTTKLQAQLCS